jgi:MFS family permease
MIRSNLGLNYTEAGMLVSAFSITDGLCQLPGGWLADRIGPRIMVAIGISGVALFGFLVGVSQSYMMLIVFLVLMALMGGGYHPASVAVISKLIEPQKRGQALGFHLVGGNASIFIAPLLAAGISVFWGWRGSYITLAIPTIALGIALYILLGRRLETNESGMAEKGNAASSRDEAPTRSSRRKLLIFFLILSVSTGALLTTMRSFIPLYMVDNFGVSEEAAAALVSLIPLAGLWASPIGGYLSDRIGRIPMILVVCFCAGPIVYLFNIVPWGPGFWAMLVVIGLINSVRMPTSEAYLASKTSQRHRSTILGIYFFTGREIGGILAPIVGYLIDQFGFNSSFNIISMALVIITLVCSVFLWGNRD